ncbi:unnamed protein product [Rotaria socialis]|uniref:HMG box domain-containing protein n=2 Tax=Rotaria socialis TaxID=392032 RepID=A0A817PKI0_9BILA|nr:unnamed protein product [Rotaria socialis]
MKSISRTENSSLSKGQTYYLGDFVYVEANDETKEPYIVCIESFEHKDNEDYLSGLQFCRPNETYHTPVHKFLRQEVFLTQSIEDLPMNKIQGLCFVSHFKDYFKYQPILDDETAFQDQDVYVCESRYNMKTKTFRKIKWWNLPENTRVKLIQRDTPLENIRIASTLGNNNSLIHRSSTTDNESINTDIIDKPKETILYDTVINEKLNENASIKKTFYEQIVISTHSFYKVGDFVYVNNIENNNNNESNKRFIFRIDKIWKENDSYCLSGTVFIQPSDITNRDQLIVTAKCRYEREVIKRDGPSTQISLDNIQGKCSVLSLKHFCTHRLTEIPESDVYVCESKYVTDDHSLRGLSKPLKRISLSLKATADEIWTFRKELILKQETPGALFKAVDESSTMELDDHFDNHLDGVERHSNHGNFDTMHNGINLNPSLSNRYNSNIINRKSNRRGLPTRPPCGYLIFASESRKRLIRDNPGIPFGEMSRIIGDQWRRIPPHEREKYEEKSRERAREQDTQVPNNTMAYDSPVNSPRIVNGGVAINGYYPSFPNVYPMNGALPVALKPPAQPLPPPPAAAIINRPPRIQRVAHSEMYSRYIEHLKTDYPFISDWPKQLKTSIGNNGNIPSRPLPSHWLINNSPGFYNNMYEALWSMRDNMWSDVVRVRNVLSDEWNKAIDRAEVLFGFKSNLSVVDVQKKTDALNLQRLFIEKKRDLTHNESVQNLVCELLICLFIQTFNYEDQDGQYISDSFSELPEQAENEPFDIVYTFDMIRQNLDQQRYRRLDAFQTDLFKVFERARKLTLPHSKVYQDSIKLEKIYLRLRDEICQHGSLLRSPALLFNEDRLQHELVRERTEKDSMANTNNQNSISPTKSSDSDENKVSVS